jgi:Escherichia/Staphylococcus phage prohead protease
MPYHIAKSAQCPTSKPWAVIKDADGKVMGCHPSHDAAYEQLKALYVHDPNAKKSLDQPIERRYFPFLELRASADADFPPQIVGHAAVFNQPSEEIFDISGWREVIRPGAFSEAIRNSDTFAFFNHNDEWILGATANGTLILEEDEIGLHARIFPPDTQKANEVLTLIRGKFIRHMSFGFTVAPDGRYPDHDKKTVVLTKVARLFDVSPVTNAAYRQTDVSARAELRVLYQKIIGESAPRLEDLHCSDENKKKHDEFLARQKDRKEFLDRRVPPPDPLSLPEIFKRCRIKIVS